MKLPIRLSGPPIINQLGRWWRSLHALLDIRSHDHLLGHPVIGKSWEGFVIEALIHAAGDNTPAYFYRSAGGAELDLILEFRGDNRWAIEIKKSAAPSLPRRFYEAADDIKAARRIVVHGGAESYPMPQGVEAMFLRDAIAAVGATG
jgi:predicted AAA+ superfamily ATPase